MANQSEEPSIGEMMVPIVFGIVILGFAIYSCCGPSPTAGKMPTVSEHTARGHMRGEAKDE